VLRILSTRPYKIKGYFLEISPNTLCVGLLHYIAIKAFPIGTKVIKIVFDFRSTGAYPFSS
jgi:hypothetical protein